MTFSYTRKAISCKYLSKNICTVVGEWHHGYFCLGYFSSSTHFDLVTLIAQKVWRLWVLVFVHDLGSRDGNCIGLPSDSGLFLSTGNMYLSTFNATQSLSILDHCSCFIFPVSGVKISQSKFPICTPLHHCCLQFLVIGHRLFSDESPCRTTRIRF